MTKVAFLGLGRMGVPMAAHLARAGHALTAWNRTPGRAGPLVELGARESKTLADAVQGAEVVILSLFGPDAVQEVLPAVVQPTNSSPPSTVRGAWARGERPAVDGEIYPGIKRGCGRRR